jgi:hypothetical protein
MASTNVLGSTSAFAHVDANARCAVVGIVALVRLLVSKRSVVARACNQPGG